MKKNTLKKATLTKNKTQKNNKELVKKCMDTFVKNRVNNRIRSFDKNVYELNKIKPSKKYINSMKKYKKKLPKLETASNKLYYCNINCKDTILEPGLPDYIPESMLKRYKYDKDNIMSDLFKKQRKDIFKNKKNVLVDNFYEGTSTKIKNKLIKEGAISQCISPSSNLTGGSIIFENSKMIKTNETFDGKPFFRKVFYIDETNMENQLRLEQAAKTEIYIVKLLMKNPDANIVTYYDVNDKYVEMEELDITSKLDKNKVIETMERVKEFLQSIGIMYIDWKPDNIGISKDGIYKLYDFDASGVVELKNPNVWIVKPLEYYSYRKAIENGITDPKEIDNYSFVKGLDIVDKYRYV